MTHTSDITALLRACACELAEDTPRLVYADAIEEAGESERGEFIRLDVWVDKLTCESKLCVGCDSCEGKAHKKRARSAALLAAHPEWVKGPKCEACDGKGGSSRPMGQGSVWSGCQACWVKGHTGPLARIPDDAITVRRGFVAEVRVPTMGEVVEEYREVVPQCHGFRPTPWARQLFDAHPLIERVVPLDREPLWNAIDELWWWYRLPGAEPSGLRGTFHHFPPPIWDGLKRGKVYPGNPNLRGYDTPDEARDDLGESLAGWLREDWLKRQGAL